MSREMREQINKIKNFGEFLNENVNKSIILYHKVGGKQISDMEGRVKNVINSGLNPYDSIGGEYSERGKIIWFASDYEQYGKNGNFVLSIEYNKKNSEKYDMHFDGQYCSVFNKIPFEDLTVIKIPIILMSGNRNLSNVFLIERINKGLTPEKLAELVNNSKYKIFIELFEIYVQPKISDINYTSKLKEHLDSIFIKYIN